MWSRKATASAALAIAISIGPPAGAAPTPAARCASTKVKITGRVTGERLQCQARAVRTGLGSNQSCEDRAVARWESAFAKAEAKGGCTTTGDGGALAAKVSSVYADVVAELAVGSTADSRRCAAAKIDATGRKATALGGCHARALYTGDSVDARCVERLETKFSGRFARAEVPGDCATMGDAAALEGKVDAFVADVVAETAGATTTTTSSTTSTTLAACCGPQRLTASGGAGLMTLAGFPSFTFPAGTMTTIDIGPANGLPVCKHQVTIPAGGFTSPAVCLPCCFFTAAITAEGCAVGGTDGGGMLWDAGTSCADADVRTVGDTSDGDCNAVGQVCTLVGAGANTLGDVDTTRGDGLCDPPGKHLQLDIPARIFTWVDGDSDPSCPDEDGTYDPGEDSPVSNFTLVLSPTTASTHAAFVDENGDGCAQAGGGATATESCSNDNTLPCGTNVDCPGGTCVTAPLRGIPATGTCCTPGEPFTLATAGLAFTGNGPLGDVVFETSIPNTVAACSAWPGPASCTPTTNPCLY